MQRQGSAGDSPGKDLGRRIECRCWPTPEKRRIRGRHTELVPLGTEHAAQLWPLASAAPDSFDYLRYGPFGDMAALSELLRDLSTRPDQPFWAAQPVGAGPQGWLSLCDVSETDGSIEIGSIWFAPALQGTAAGREAIFLLMIEAMDRLGYERLVWRCHAQNAASARAACNLGFCHEGTWRNAAVVDCWQRDIAWFSILREEWPARRAALQDWLDPGNFDRDGRQKRRLRMP